MYGCVRLFSEKKVNITKVLACPMCFKICSLTVASHLLNMLFACSLTIA